MKLVRSQKGQGATMTLELDGVASDHIIDKIKAIDGMNRVISINPVGGAQ